jgi:hypothetical protein
MGLHPASKVSLSDLALLLAVPLTEEEFVSAAGKSDWLSKYYDQDLDAANRSETLKRHWSDEYLPFVAEPLQKLADLARELSVEIRPRAELADVTECSASKSVLILFAHWKGPEVLTDDFVTRIETSEFLKRAQKSETALAKWIAASLCSNAYQEHKKSIVAHILAALRWNSSRGVRQVLADALNVPLPGDIPGPGINKVLERPITRMTQRRDEIDALFVGLVKPGNRLELFDGLHAKEDVESSIAGSFEGILDLTVCTSTVLADYIAARRHQRLRTVQFPTVQDFLWGAQCISETLKLVARHHSYLQARVTANQVLRDAVREIAQYDRERT